MNLRFKTEDVWITGLLLLTGIFWIRLGGLNTGFVGEDIVFLRYSFANPKPWLWAISHPNEFGLYRPLGHQIFFLLGRALFGIHSGPFHLFQLSVHLANTGLLFTLLAKLNPKVPKFYPAALAFFWGTLGIYSEAVLWISATNNLLYVLFFLLLAHRFPIGSPVSTGAPEDSLPETLRRNWFPFFLATLALASKEFAIFLPVWILLFIPWQKKSFAVLLPYCALVGAYLLYRIYFGLPGSAAYKPEFGAKSAAAFLTYVRWSLECLVPAIFFGLYLLLFAKDSSGKGAYKYIFFYALFLLFLSWWPEHVRAEFLYLPLLALVLAIGQAMTRHILVSLVLLFSIILSPLHWITAREYQQNLHIRSVTLESLKSEVTQIELQVKQPDPGEYWLRLNEKLGGDHVYAAWYIDFYFPGKFPCLISNWQNLFRREAANPETTKLTPELFRCGLSE